VQHRGHLIGGVVLQLTTGAQRGEPGQHPQLLGLGVGDHPFPVDGRVQGLVRAQAGHVGGGQHRDLTAT
jgi:hypothetical protein